MPWAPDDVAAVCHWLEPMYHRWFASDAVRDRRCLLLRLEDLAADWSGERGRLFGWLRLPDAETDLTVSADRLTHWRALSARDETYVRQRLAFAIEAFGYR